MKILLNVLYTIVGLVAFAAVAVASYFFGFWMIKGLIAVVALLICWALGKNIMGELW